MGMLMQPGAAVVVIIAMQIARFSSLPLPTGAFETSGPLIEK